MSPRTLRQLGWFTCLVALKNSPLGVLDATRYASLRTFRLDGTWVETPIWFAREVDCLYLRTGEATGKIRRIRGDSRVELRPCDYRGRYVANAPVVSGTAGICEGDERRRGEACLKKRYRWQWNVIPMIPLRGLSNPHPGLTLRERIARARSQDPLPGTCVVKIDVTDKDH